MTKKKDKRAGFTLLELLLAVSILVLILTVAYSGLSNILRGNKLLADKREASAIANAVLSRITRELQLTYLEERTALLPARDSKSDQPSLAVLFGEEKSLPNGARGDSVTFLALEGGQYLPDGGTHSGVVQITYRVEEDPEQSGTSNATYLLIRDETPHIRPPERAYERTMTFPITNRITSLQFSYYDSKDQTWLQSWGKDKPRNLPTLIRFRVGLRTPSGVERTLETIVPLRSEG